MDTTTSVLVVGGGLNGLAAACLLVDQGVACTVIERHADTSIQFKFAGISPRSMEIFRALGLEDQIRANRTGDQQGGSLVRGRNLADPDLAWGGAAWPDASSASPTQPATCDQHVLEPILRQHAQRLGADVRFNTDFETFEQVKRGVHARIRDRSTGEACTIAADYLIAADGATGSVRESLGIPCSGPGALQHWMNLIFRTDLPPTLNGRRFTSCFVTDLNASLIPRDEGRWLLSLQYFPDKGERPEDFTAGRCRELVVRAAGRSDIRVDLIDARAWEAAARVAHRFRAGRCFLVGDAAHVMPPTGAFGGNSGIHDAHNLAWKLGMVVRGQTGDALLDSYDAERRPVIEATLAQALARLQKWFADPMKRLPPPVELVDDYDVVLGQRYANGALVAEGLASERAFEPFRSLSGRPGTRAPHVPLTRAGKSMSTLDLFGHGFVLLCADSAWANAADAVNKQSSVALSCHCFSRGGDAADVHGQWLSAYGIEPLGAVLVRPDGFVAWRSRRGEVDPTRTLVEVLGRLGVRTKGRRASLSRRHGEPDRPGLRASGRGLSQIRQSA